MEEFGMVRGLGWYLMTPRFCVFSFLLLSLALSLFVPLPRPHNCLLLTKSHIFSKGQRCGTTVEGLSSAVVVSLLCVFISLARRSSCFPLLLVRYIGSKTNRPISRLHVHVVLAMVIPARRLPLLFLPCTYTICT